MKPRKKVGLTVPLESAAKQIVRKHLGAPEGWEPDAGCPCHLCKQYGRALRTLRTGR